MLTFLDVNVALAIFSIAIAIFALGLLLYVLATQPHRNAALAAQAQPIVNLTGSRRNSQIFPAAQRSSIIDLSELGLDANPSHNRRRRRSQDNEFIEEIHSFPAAATEAQVKHPEAQMLRLPEESSNQPVKLAEKEHPIHEEESTCF